jgi:hypothetical protein
MTVPIDPPSDVTSTDGEDDPITIIEIDSDQDD